MVKRFKVKIIETHFIFDFWIWITRNQSYFIIDLDLFHNQDSSPLEHKGEKQSKRKRK